MTLGDSRVGIDINPSGSKTIAEIKSRTADLIGAVDAIDLPGEAPGEIARLKALAMTEIESAVMWAGMAAARSEAASRLPGVAARIATTLRSFCEAVGWPRLRRLSDAIARVRESERRAAAAPKPAPAPGPALTANPQGEIHLAVTWQREIDDSGGKYPPAESGGGWLYGTSDDPRLAITLAWTEAKFDRSTRENYETLHFVTAIGEVEGKTLFVSGRCVGRVTYSNIPCDAQLYHEVHGALKEDHGGGFFTSQTTQVIVAFRRGDEHMQQSPQGDLFSAPPEPPAERNELDEGLCCKLGEGAMRDQGLPVHLMFLRWPDGPVAMPWPRSGRTVRDRRRARRSGPRRQCRPGGRTSRPGPCAARASTRSP